MKKIILASASASRKKHLERLKVEFEAITPQINEDTLKNSYKDHLQLSRELSKLKARSVSSEYNQAIIISGDTITSFNGTILSKPRTKENAFKQLKILNGREHQVITSLVIKADNREFINTVVAQMKMRKLSDKQIVRYIDVDEPLYSCGSCRLDSMGISLFESINCEDYTAIIGIPLMWTAKTLSELGVSVP
ncbi:MAG: Maf family nucleotide pyrophosphatase [Pseudomonadota bacterium]|nr:Maf family nucleotide pyrophosphatase [Pseudomonadota bacterium]